MDGHRAPGPTRAPAEHDGDGQRGRAGHQPDGVHEHQRDAADRKAVQQPEPVARDVEGEERQRDVARCAPPEHLARLQQRRRARHEPVSRDDGSEQWGERVEHGDDGTAGRWRLRGRRVESGWRPAGGGLPRRIE